MASKWEPESEVGLNEHIGRRMFDEPMLKGTVDQPSFGGVLLTHFEEKRGKEVSLDRLGRSGIEKRVTKYLLPRAEAAGLRFKPPKQFDAWYYVKARELANSHKDPKLKVIASPIADQDPDANKYHAHVGRPDDLNPYQMALHLRYIFTQYGNVERNANRKANLRNRLLQHPVALWLVKKFSR